MATRMNSVCRSPGMTAYEAGSRHRGIWYALQKAPGFGDRGPSGGEASFETLAARLCDVAFGGPGTRRAAIEDTYMYLIFQRLQGASSYAWLQRHYRAFVTWRFR